jgi:hypothetical protein
VWRFLRAATADASDVPGNLTVTGPVTGNSGDIVGAFMSAYFDADVSNIAGGSYKDQSAVVTDASITTPITFPSITTQTAGAMHTVFGFKIVDSNGSFGAITNYAEEADSFTNVRTGGGVIQATRVIAAAGATGATTSAITTATAAGRSLAISVAIKPVVLTTVGVTRGLPYQILKLAPDANTRLPYQIFQLAPDANTRLPYKILNTIGSTSRLPFGILNSVGTTRNLPYLLAQLAGTTRRLPYGMSGALGITRALPSTIRQLAGTTRRAPYQILNVVGVERRLPYGIRVLAGTTRWLPYGMRVLAGSTRRVPYQVNTTAGTTRRLPFGILNRVGAGGSGSYVDTFDVLDPGWTIANYGGGGASATIVAGKLRLVSTGDFWTTADGGIVALRLLTGSGPWTAQVKVDSDAGSHMRFMQFRSGVANSAANVGILQDGDASNITLMSRDTDGGDSAWAGENTGPARPAFPFYLRAVLASDRRNVTAYVSSDGENWTVIGTRGASQDLAYIGLAATQHGSYNDFDDFVLSPAYTGVRLPFRILNLVGTTRRAPYSISNILGATRRLPYQINTAAGTTRRAPYQINTLAGTTRRLPFAILNKTGTTRAIRYQVNNLAGTTRRVPYQIRAMIGSTRRVPYQVNNVVGSTRRLPFGIGGSIGITRALPFNINNIAGVTRSLPYSMQSIVGVLRRLRYTIFQNVYRRIIGDTGGIVPMYQTGGVVRDEARMTGGSATERMTNAVAMSSDTGGIVSAGLTGGVVRGEGRLTGGTDDETVVNTGGNVRDNSTGGRTD